MDSTGRKITKIAREAEKLVLLTLREGSVGTAEIDLIHALRHHPGCTQAQLAELLHADKAAIARRTKNLESKGFLVRRANPSDKRSQLLFPTPKAEALKTSKAGIEAAFYEYLTSALTGEEAAVFAARWISCIPSPRPKAARAFPTSLQERLPQRSVIWGTTPSLAPIPCAATCVAAAEACAFPEDRHSGWRWQEHWLIRALC